MTKTVRNTASASEESFHKHYAAIWGEGRWRNSLYPALAQPTRYAALMNRYVSAAGFHAAIQDADLEAVPVIKGDVNVSRDGLERIQLPDLEEFTDDKDSALLCYARGSEKSPNDDDHSVVTVTNDFPQPQPSSTHPNHLLTHWNLDAASVLVAHLLNIHPDESVLDLCASPGGKSIALAQKLWPSQWADNAGSSRATPDKGTGRLVSNEIDGKRQKRLAENLQAYLPSSLIKQGKVVTTRVDASQPGLGLNALLAGGSSYDKVLVDAPCSSERHIIHAHLKARASGNTAPEMANWRAGSSKRLAKTQVDLLLTALKAVKVGGQVMYATCSLEPTENEGVIEKMLALVEKERKKGQKWKVEVGFGKGQDCEDLEKELEERWAERTKYGWICLPDHPTDGRWGPLFFARITKVDGK